MNKLSSVLTLEVGIETVYVLMVDVDLRLECLLDIFCTNRHCCSVGCDSEQVVK